MKLESLVIANQPCRGEYVLVPCTHRPSARESWGWPKIRCYTGFKPKPAISGKS